MTLFKQSIVLNNLRKKCTDNTRANINIFKSRPDQRAYSSVIQSLNKSTGRDLLKQRKKVPNQSLVQIRSQHNASNPSTSKKSVKQMVVYVLSIAVGAGVGISVGRYFFTDLGNEKDPKKVVDERQKYKKFLKKKLIEHQNSLFTNFPYKLVLYQYYSCPYCTQIRTYLDYFGFNYKLVEVDSYSKQTLSKFTLAKQLPILVLKDKETGAQLHLTNATAILSAMESLRNSEYDEYEDILNKYLPTLFGNKLHYAVNPFKYHVSNSDINSIEWRRWINNQAAPAFRLHSISDSKKLFETFDFYSSKSDWAKRYSTWKYYYVYYYNTFWTYMTYENLLKKFDKNMKPEDILNDVIKIWENGLKENKFMSGLDKPDLADLTMFGNVSSYDGLSYFNPILQQNSKFHTWYIHMQDVMKKGPRAAEAVNNLQFMKSANEINKTIPAEAFSSEISNDKVNSYTQTESSETGSNLVASNSDSGLNLRVLSINYLVHVMAFTLAAWSGR